MKAGELKSRFPIAEFNGNLYKEIRFPQLPLELEHITTFYGKLPLGKTIITFIVPEPLDRVLEGKIRQRGNALRNFRHANYIVCEFLKLQKLFRTIN